VKVTVSKLSRRFSFFYFLLFLPVGMQAPYLFLFFKRQGFSDAELGTLAAVTPIMNFLAPPLWGAIADALGDRRRMLAILLVAAALASPWLMWSSSFWTTLVLLAVFSAFAFAPASIADAITLENVARAGGDYGRLRLWGSIGFAAPLLAFGFVLKRGTGGSAASLYPIFIGYCLTRLFSVGWVGLLPPSRGHGERRLDLRGARALLNRRFLTLALCAVIATAAMSAYYLFFSIYLDAVGVADNLKGYLWAVAVAAETGMMLVVGRVIRRIGLKWTFVLGILGTALRLLAFSFTLPPWGIAVSQLLHALTFSALMVSSVTFVSRLTPPKLRATGQTIWGALTSGLGAAAGSKLAGLAAAAWGLMPMYRAFSCVAATALLAALVLVREPAAAEAPLAADPDS
jgi:PPP family 3-phenylpropionic acid transporter